MVEKRNVGAYIDAVLVGRGGFGSVYRARDEQHGRDVAVKVLDGDLHSDGRVRFDRERKAMGRLGGHPNIVPIYDSGYTEDGQAYLVMEFASGGSLRSRLDEFGPMNWRDAIALITPIADAVETAHRAGILHRDIKPDNVLIDEFGRPKLSDFGIAAVTSGATTTKGASASLAHAAPELLEGRSAAASMDVYALGSTLHTMIAGLPPFVLSTDESVAPMVRRIMMQPPPDLRPLGVPEPVAVEIERALAKEPELRHASAAEFGVALAAAVRAVDGSTETEVIGVVAPPVTPPMPAAPAASATAAVQPEPIAAPFEAAGAAPVASGSRGRGPLVLVGAAVALLAIVGGAFAFTRGDSGTDVDVAGATVTSSTTTSITTTTLAPVEVSVSIDCPTEVALGSELVCAIDSENAVEGEWNLPGFLDAPAALETVPGSNPIFLGPTDPGAVGREFTISVSVLADDGTEATAEHRFTVIAAPATADSTTTTVAPTTAAPAAAPPTTVRRTTTTRPPTTAAPAAPAPTTAPPATPAPTTAPPATPPPTPPPTTAAPAPTVSISCPGSIALNANITCSIISANATSGSWRLPGFFGGSLGLSTVPGTNAIFINPTNANVVGQTFTISATVQNAAGQSASASASFTVTG